MFVVLVRVGNSEGAMMGELSMLFFVGACSLALVRKRRYHYYLVFWGNRDV